MDRHDNTLGSHEANVLGGWMPPNASLTPMIEPNSHRSPSPPGDRDDFKIAIICALPLEANIVSALFDRKWDGRWYGKGAGDSNVYSFGLIGRHNVVLAHMPNMGKVAAAAAAVGLRASFQKINLALVVGICGGAPLGEHHSEIFLGDVVVSEGIIQYDFGRRFPNNIFVRKDTPQDNLPRPNPEIRATIAKLRADHSWLQDKVSRHLHDLQRKFSAEVTYPGPSEDILFNPTYQHKHQRSSECTICSGSNGRGDVCDTVLGLSCELLECDLQGAVFRRKSTQPPATSAEWKPAVHFGLFASGDTVMKSGKDRDDIAARDGVIAFEMEGAGVWENLPGTLVIKGICDYADSHKSKKWQPYAAATATAVTKAFLEEWRIASSEEQSPHRSALYPQHGLGREVEAHRDPIRKAKELDILRKLYKSQYEDRKDRNPIRTEGTCEWFVAHRLFREWQENKESTTLWVSADPGCGKSVLAKHLIDSVLPSTASRTTCYFFFKDDFEDQRSVVSALCCILHQLFKQNRTLLTEAILEQFEIYMEDITGSFSKLWSTLLSAVKDNNAGEIVCILDAVDECEESGRSQLAEALYALYRHRKNSKDSNLKFLLTSRPYISIRHGFKRPDIPQLAVIHLSGENDIEMAKISQEIDIFIQSKVQLVKKRLKLTNSERDLLLRELMRIPNRTYLWVHLTLDLIQDDPNLDEVGIFGATSHLPRSVEEAYERILSRSRDLKEAKKLLHIVVAASRPLTLKEMNFALALRNNHRSYNNFKLKSEERFQENVRDLCGLFVVVVDSKIYLLHQTAKEFLVQDDQTNAIKRTNLDLEWKHSLRPQESHGILAEICIRHLLFVEFEAESFSPNAKHTFLDYSAKHWTTHLRESRIDVKNSPFSISILRLCDTTSSSCLSWLRIYWSGTNTDFPGDFTPLMTASYFGLTEVMKCLYKLDNAELNLQDDTYGRSALSWAAGNGFHGAVKLLISRWRGFRLLSRVGARVDSVDRDGLTPLSHAILNSHVAAAKLLLKAGARVDTKDGIGGTPLSYAICNGHEQIIKLMFKKKTNINTEEDISTPLLLSAAEKGREDIVKLLLDRGLVDPNTVNTYGQTPLSLAIMNHHITVAKLLIEAPGVNIDITADEVIALAATPHDGQEVMILLLDRFADSMTFTENTVLEIITRFNKEVVILLLGRCGDQIKFTTEIVLEIVTRFDKRVVILLLNRYGGYINITEKIVLVFITRFDKEVAVLFLNRCGHQIDITEKIMLQIIIRFDKEVALLLFHRYGDQIAITEQMASKIITQFDKDTVVFLLNRCKHWIAITEKIVLKMITRFDKEVVVLFLNRCGHQIDITEKIMLQIIIRFDKEVALLLFHRYRDQIAITEQMASTICTQFDKDTIFLFLDRYRGQIPEEMVLEIITRFNKEVALLLFHWYGDQIAITEQIASIMITQFDKDMAVLLLDRYGGQIPEEMVLRIIPQCNQEVVVLLLDRYGDHITITGDIVSKLVDKEVITTALIERHKGKITGCALSKIVVQFDSEVVMLLLNHYQGQINMTKKAILRIIRKFSKEGFGRQVIIQALSQPRNRLAMTEKAGLLLLAKYDEEVIALFLGQHGESMPIKEEAFKAAAQNWTNGKEVMTLLCNSQRGQTVITKEIFNAAAHNPISGKEAMAVLCNWRGGKMTSEERAFQAMAEQWKSIENILPSFRDF
ncbi:hypothetical protein TrVFT333_001065 [Trichoderma virens FT-333]|nr:hypothetical protein TrVFT333_001065 [Trichoderma virens FT-333]